MTVWGLDAALNRSEPPIVYRWDVDTIPPGLLLSGIPGGRRGDHGRRPPRSTSGRASRGRLFCSLDGAEFAPCTTPAVYLGLLDGAHTFEVYVQDRAGNVSITASRSWTVDAVP